MTETVQLPPSILDDFAQKFTDFYDAKQYAEAYPYGIVLFDQGRRDKDFLHHLASVSVFNNKRTPVLKRLRAWAEEPDADAIAHELIAGLAHHLGDEQENREQARLYASKSALAHSAVYETVKLRVVVLQTVASGVYNFNAAKHSFNIPEGHNNLNGMLAPFINQYVVRVDDLAAAQAALESLERPDVIYNSITDPDRCAEALGNAMALCDHFADIPVVNHPRAILETTRDNNYQRFHKNRHIIYPKNVKLPLVEGGCHAKIVAAIEEHGLQYPVIARLSGFQGGKNMHLIHSAEDQDFADFDAGVKDSPKDIYLIEYTDVSFTDKRAPDVTFYPKYRAFLAGGKLYPVHLFVAADDYNVHLANSRAVMAKYDWLVNMDKAYCKDPESIIPKKLWSALEKVMCKAGLDYMGVDFAIGKDKQGNEGVVIFEANAAMRNEMRGERLEMYHRIQYQNLTRRMHHVFCDKANVPTWNFYLPLELKSS